MPSPATHRLTPGSSIAFVKMGRPNSNFHFIEKYFAGLTTLRRILSQVRTHGGKTIVLELIENAPDISEEDEDIRALAPSFDHSEVYRLSFFSRRISNAKRLESVTDDDFIGFASVKIDCFGDQQNCSRVFESVIRRSSQPNNYIKGEQTWEILVGQRTMRVRGYLYAQQNGITNCCAHVAVRTASARFRDGGLSYREMASILSPNPDLPADGLGTEQIVKLLEASGAKCLVADFQHSAQPSVAPFQKFVYASIESGYPAIIIFRSGPDSHHAIPLFGHTFNADTWVPSAERLYFKVGKTTRYLPSESWISMFVGHDDNWGSNYCIPRHYFQIQNNTEPSVLSGECIAQVIATLPADVEVNGVAAEIIAADYLFALRPSLETLADNQWAQRLKQYADDGLLVLRPLLIDLAEYASHLNRVRDWDNRSISSDFIAILKEVQNEKVWMVEVSVPELFSANLRKVGEVLVRAGQKLGPERDFSGFFLARLPEYFALYQGGSPDRPKFLFVSATASGHVELFGCEEID